MLKTLVRRIEVAERAAVGRLKFAEDCICFLAKEPPVFFSDEQQEAAYKVYMATASKKSHPLFRPAWRWERQARAWKNREAQHKKAWLASGLPAPEWNGQPIEPSV